MPTAFVMMPFDEESLPVYTDFLKPVLENAGFQVDRADEFQSQQSILQDIVRGIATSDLVVADLTGNNPNVFYELGLAHALTKPVILVTQSVAEAPFDLRSYRMLEYSRDFSLINAAKESLDRYARAFLHGDLQFGNPVTDFFGNESIPSRGGTLLTGSSDECPTFDDGPGFVDHLVEVTEGYNQVTDVTLTLGSSLGDLSRHFTEATSEIAMITANPTPTSGSALRGVCRRLAHRVSNFTGDVAAANLVYSRVLDNTEGSLELLVSTARENVDPDDPTFSDSMSELRDLRGKTQFARDSILQFAEVMETSPRVERRLNTQMTRASHEIRILANHLDRMIGSITRALNAGPGAA